MNQHSKVGKTPTFANTLGAIGETERIERRIAIQNRNLDHHKNKWGSLTVAEQEGGLTII